MIEKKSIFVFNVHGIGTEDGLIFDTVVGEFCLCATKGVSFTPIANEPNAFEITYIFENEPNIDGFVSVIKEMIKKTLDKATSNFLHYPCKEDDCIFKIDWCFDIEGKICRGVEYYQ